MVVKAVTRQQQLPPLTREATWRRRSPHAASCSSTCSSRNSSSNNSSSRCMLQADISSTRPSRCLSSRFSAAAAATAARAAAATATGGFAALSLSVAAVSYGVSLQQRLSTPQASRHKKSLIFPACSFYTLQGRSRERGGPGPHPTSSVGRHRLTGRAGLAARVRTPLNADTHTHIININQSGLDAEAVAHITSRRSSSSSSYEGEEGNLEAAQADASVLEPPPTAAAAAAALATESVASEEPVVEELQDTPPLPHDDENSGQRQSSAAVRTPWLQREGPLPTALGGALLGLVLLLVIASERRLAGARAILSHTKADATRGAGEEAMMREALQREGVTIHVLQEQLEQSQQERRAAIQALSGLAKKRADVSSRLVLLRGSSAKQATAQDVAAARERVQRAVDAKIEAMRELEQQQLLNSLTEDTARVFLWHAGDDKEALDVEAQAVGRCTEGLTKAQTLDEATIAKRGEFFAVKTALTKAREELEVLEAQEAESARAAAEAGAAGAEAGEVTAMRHSFARERRSMILRAEEEEEHLRSELARLQKAPAYYSKAFERMQRANADLAKLKRELESYTVVAEQREASAEKDQDKEAAALAELEALSPEEKDLYQARLRLLQLDLQKQTIEAQLVVISSVAEKAEYLRASRDLLKLTAMAKRAPASEATNEAATQERARVIAAARKRAAAAHQAVEDKDFLLGNLQERLHAVTEEAKTARSRVARKERKVKALEARNERALATPQAYAVSEMEALTTELGNLEMAISEVWSMAGEFSLDSYEDTPEEKREYYWASKIETLATESLHLMHSLFAAGNRLLLAVERAQDELQLRLLRNELQALPFLELAGHAIEGAKSQLLQQLVNKRWEAIQKEIKTRRNVLQTSVNHMQMLRRALDDLACSNYWCEGLGPLKVRAYAFMAREEARQDFCRRRVDYLQTLTKEGIEKELERLFGEAAWELKEQMEQYGKEAKTLEAFKTARATACKEYAKRLRDFKSVIAKQASQMAPPVHFKDLPVVQVPEKGERKPRRHRDEESPDKTNQRDLGHLEGFTVPGVQLRKK
ncbi:hypothetical protein ACSSS7_006963 [Eimeria intestinalis]